MNIKRYLYLRGFRWSSIVVVVVESGSRRGTAIVDLGRSWRIHHQQNKFLLLLKLQTGFVTLHYRITLSLTDQLIMQLVRNNGKILKCERELTSFNFRIGSAIYLIVRVSYFTTWALVCFTPFSESQHLVDFLF